VDLRRTTLSSARLSLTAFTPDDAEPRRIIVAAACEHPEIVYRIRLRILDERPTFPYCSSVVAALLSLAL
jgi:hypothetical protein